MCIRDSYLGLPPICPHAEHFPEGTDDVRIVDDRLLATASKGFMEVDSSPPNHLHFLVRNAPLRNGPLVAYATIQSDPRADNFEVWATRADHRIYLVEVRCLLPTEGHLQDLLLVAVSQDAEGNDLTYESVHPAVVDLARTDGHYTMAFRFDPLVGATKHLVYFWNGTDRAVPIEALDIRVSELN